MRLLGYNQLWHSKFYHFSISKPVTDIYLKQVTVEQHMKEIYYLEAKSFFLKKP